MNSYYVAANIHEAIIFIKANTNWVQTTNVSFRNGKEKITVISDFMRIRGKVFDKVYNDYSYTNVRQWEDFVKRFRMLDIYPITLKEKE